MGLENASLCHGPSILGLICRLPCLALFTRLAPNCCFLSCSAFNSSQIDIKHCCWHQGDGVISPTQKLTKVQGKTKSLLLYSFTPFTDCSMSPMCSSEQGSRGVQLNHKKGIKVALEGGNYALLFPTFQPLLGENLGGVWRHE